MKRFKPEHVYVEHAAKNTRHASAILDRLQDVPVTHIKNRHELFKEFKNKPDPISLGKRSLLLAYDEGETFKPFRESEQYLSCDYFTLHAEEGCDLECSYCFLQSHLTNPLLTLYTHLDEMLKNLESTLQKNSNQFFRIGTGQLADSLSLDHISGFSETLIPFFAKQKNATLELKTKSDNIDRLLPLDPEGKTIISWSMNSERIQKQEEHKCASINERVSAAKKLISNSHYRVGFHFDPIIDYAEWQKDYEITIHKIAEAIPEEKIAWISMGCFRGDPELKTIMQTRFPKTEIPIGEYIKGMDGKLRYFKPKRIKIYQEMDKMLRAHFPGTTFYLSMESAEVWHHVFGGEHKKETVCEMLDQAATKSS